MLSEARSGSSWHLAASRPPLPPSFHLVGSVAASPAENLLNSSPLGASTARSIELTLIFQKGKEGSVKLYINPSYRLGCLEI